MRMEGKTMQNPMAQTGNNKNRKLGIFAYCITDFEGFFVENTSTPMKKFQKK